MGEGTKYQKGDPVWEVWTKICRSLSGHVTGIRITADPEMLKSAERTKKKYAKRKALRKSANNPSAERYEDLWTENSVPPL